MCSHLQEIKTWTQGGSKNEEDLTTGEERWGRVQGGSSLCSDVSDNRGESVHFLLLSTCVGLSTRCVQ